MYGNQNICLLENIYTFPPPSELCKDRLPITLLDIVKENESKHVPNKLQREGNRMEAGEVDFKNKSIFTMSKNPSQILTSFFKSNILIYLNGT